MQIINIGMNTVGMNTDKNKIEREQERRHHRDVNLKKETNFTEIKSRNCTSNRYSM